MGLLRIILAVTVVIAHSDALFGFRFTGGLVAVQTFFIISGFYMTMILDKKYTGKGSYVLFLSNRFLRLYPLFWVVLIFTVVASTVLHALTGDWFRLSPYVEYFDSMGVGTLLFLATANIALLGQDIVLFLGFVRDTGGMHFTHDFSTSEPMLYKFLFVPQAWSLGIEVMFYLIAPFVVRKSNFWIVSLIVLSMLTRVFTYLFLGYMNDPWTYRFFPSELALFLLGTISYRLYDVYKIQKTTLFGYKPSRVVVGLFFLIVIFYQFVPTLGSMHVNNWLFYGFSCVAIPFVFEETKSSKIDSRIGEMSYPIYITHILAIGAIAPILPVSGWQGYDGELAVLSTMVASYILVVLISDPIEKIRQSRVKREHSI